MSADAGRVVEAVASVFGVKVCQDSSVGISAGLRLLSVAWTGLLDGVVELSTTFRTGVGGGRALASLTLDSIDILLTSIRCKHSPNLFLEGAATEECRGSILGVFLDRFLSSFTADSATLCESCTLSFHNPTPLDDLSVGWTPRQCLGLCPTELLDGGNEVAILDEGLGFDERLLGFLVALGARRKDSHTHALAKVELSRAWALEELIVTGDTLKFLRSKLFEFVVGEPSLPAGVVGALNLVGEQHGVVCDPLALSEIVESSPVSLLLIEEELGTVELKVAKTKSLIGSLALKTETLTSDAEVASTKFGTESTILVPVFGGHVELTDVLTEGTILREHATVEVPTIPELTLTERAVEPTLAQEGILLSELVAGCVTSELNTVRQRPRKRDRGSVE